MPGLINYIEMKKQELSGAVTWYTDLINRQTNKSGPEQMVAEQLYVFAPLNNAIKVLDGIKHVLEGKSASLQVANLETVVLSPIQLALSQLKANGEFGILGELLRKVVDPAYIFNKKTVGVLGKYGLGLQKWWF